MINALHYHCANAPKPLTIGESRDTARGTHTLCGLPVIGYIWDYPKDFADDSDPHETEKCPVCLNHPDYPLLVLGDT